MARRIIQHLPEYYQLIDDVKQLDHTETMELDQLQKAVDQLFDDQFVMTAGQQAIRRREQMLGIQADPTTETLDLRRRRILNRYQTKPPFTVRYLQQQLDRLVGPGMTVVSVDVESFMLTVTANIENATVFKEVQHTIDTIKPANLAYRQNTAIHAGIELSHRISMRRLNKNYVLNGSWQLGASPFATFGPEVPIV